MLTDLAAFLMNTLFNLYLYVVVLRLLLQAIRVRFDNPLAAFAIKLTQPAVGPLQRILPEVKRVDLAIVAFALALEFVRFLLLDTLGAIPSVNIVGLGLLSVADLLRHFSSLYFYAIIFRAIMSLLVVLRYNPIVFVVGQLTEPLLFPIRRLIPPVAGFDLSPLIALILLQVFEAVVVGGIYRLI